MEIRRQSHMGNSIPMVMVTTADLSGALKGFSHDDLADSRKAVRELRKEIKDKDVVGSTLPSQKTDAEKNSTFLAEEQTWTNTDGKAIIAAIITADDSTVTFQMTDGKAVSYPLNKLSASSIETIEGLLEK